MYVIDVPAGLAVSTRMSIFEKGDNWDTCLTQCVGLFLAGIH